MDKYTKYKDSGVEWIGEIPKHWDMCRLKSYCTLKGRIGWNGLRSEEFKETSYAYLVTGQDFNSASIQWDECYQIDKDRYEEDPFIQLNEGDLLITKDGTIGKIAKVSNLDKPACLNSGIFVMKQRNIKFDQGFLYWLLCSNILKDFNAYTSSGTTILHLYQNVFERMPMPIPTINEQQSIAKYLDSKCSKIDHVIAAQQKRVELLKELKQSIITRAVTRGINPNAKMKDSGVEWIGEIPEHWIVKPFKYTMRIFNGADYKEVETDDEDGIPVYGSGGCFTFATKEMYNGEVVFLGRKGTVNKPLYYNGSFWAIDTMFYAIPSKGTQCRFMYYQALSFPFDYYQTNTARPSMTQTDLGDNKVVFPPYSEQIAIASFLDSKCFSIDSQISKINRQIELLQELKQSIITEVVTGKRKVC